MKVHASTRRKALLDIYQMHRKPRGGVLTARDLERDWKRTGLRRSDLALALADMTRHYLLLRKAAHDGACYELTYLGERAMQLLMLGGPLTTLHDWMTLRRARRRQPHGTAPSAPKNRRAGDHASNTSADDAPPAAPDAAPVAPR